jgi:diguanylate cyclase (GGDEF)-like protein
MAELSTALAEIASPGETASKLVRLTPAIVDCERALVLLPDVAGGMPLLSAAHGYDEEALARLRAQLFGRAVSEGSSDAIGECLSESGLGDVLIEPIGTSGDPVGWICAGGWEGEGSSSWRGELRARLRGVAAQAATAISNAHLLDQIRHQALHDGLTGLPNRMLIQDRLEQMLARARRHNVPVAVLFLDLDGFKDVNDNLGHDAGDELLRVVARRLTTTLRESDVVGRLGGDEFVILSEDAASENDPDLIATRIIAALSEPVDLEAGEQDNTLRISASLGSTCGDRQTPSELLRDADLALYEAKRTGKNRHVRFQSAMHTAARSQALLERDLRAAVETNRFELFYQPIFDLNDERVTGAEALLRWDDPVRGTVMPDVFIPVLEANGMIVEVGRWVLGQACRQAANWHEQGYAINVSVNVSPRQLERETFVSDVTEALAGASLPAAFLILEVTETAIMRDPATAVAQLQALKQLGVRIAIDDFGTGHSSLAYLQQFPVDAIKIDRSFVAAMADSAEASTIIRALVDLGRTLGLETLAEGIEDGGQRRSLEQAHCDSGQGYLFARPVRPEALQDLLASRGVSAPAGS